MRKTKRGSKRQALNYYIGILFLVFMGTNANDLLTFYQRYISAWPYTSSIGLRSAYEMSRGHKLVFRRIFSFKYFTRGKSALLIVHAFSCMKSCRIINAHPNHIMTFTFCNWWRSVYWVLDLATKCHSLLLPSDLITRSRVRRSLDTI